MYYDPNKIVGTEEGNKTNQLSLDISVYSELFLPENYRDSAAATGSGYGNYDIVINQTSSHNGIFEYVGGRIAKNDMVLYNPNIVQKPFSNVFYPPSEMTTASAATPEGIAERRKKHLMSCLSWRMKKCTMPMSAWIKYIHFLNSKHWRKRMILNRPGARSV